MRLEGIRRLASTGAGLVCVIAILLVLDTAPCLAQASGPYVSGHIGVSGGDGGAALAAGGSVGYMTPRRIGFEIELSVSPGLDFGDLGRLNGRPQFPVPLPIPIEEPSIDATGRLLTFHTNVVASLPTGGKLRVFVVGGGGVANLDQDALFRFPEFVIPPNFADNPTLVPLDVVTVEHRTSRSENALSLNAGGIVEYAWTARFSLGVDARYTHAFFEREGLNTARVAARATWRF
jgi:hypothetical protein